MLNKKFIPLVLISLLGLTACDDEVVAKPTGYDDDKIMTVTGSSEEIYNNMMSIIYDGIRDGSLGSDVLNKVLYQYSLSVFGRYNEKIEGYTEGEITLKEAAEDVLANGGYTKVNAFILAHKAFWTVDNDGNRVNDSGEKVSDTETPCSSERSRVLSKWQSIEKRIAKKMYAEISSGSYSDRGVFYEERYLMSLRSSLHNVEDPLGIPAGSTFVGELDPQYEEETVFDHYLTRDFYSGAEHNYIEEEIVPKIYNEMLIEQYVLDNQYGTIQRSYARKVNIVSISNNSEYPLAARYLINEFVDNYISGANAAPKGEGGAAVTSVRDSKNKVGLDELKIVSNAWKGTNLGDKEKALLNALVDDKVMELDDTDPNNVFYKGTEYGDLMADYNKISDDPHLTDTSIESTFTNSGAYTKEEGLKIKKRDVNAKDHTQNGWFLKSGGLSDLPMRSRLFDVGVATALSELDAKDDDASKAKVAEQDRWQYDAASSSWKYTKPEHESAYVAKINGRYFLKNSVTESGQFDKDMVFYDSSSSTYYIVEIEEAASTSKLSKENANRYAETRGNDVAEEFINEIVEKVASSDTYRGLSTKYWLEKASLTYHDTVVYDYFKANYPELFD